MSTVTGYDDLTHGQTKAIVSKMGGVKMALALLRDEYKLIPVAKPVFDPVVFIGKGWSFAEARDPRSAALGLLDDYSKVKLSTDWLEGESRVTGENRRTRILADATHTPLNVDHFFDLRNHKEKIPKEWKKVEGGITFDGDVLRDPDGYRYVLYLCWDDGRWDWSCRWLVSDWNADYPSAVLA